jgi:fucose permease
LISDNPQSPNSRLRTERVAVSTAFLLNGIVVGGWVSRIPAVQQHLALTSGMLGIVLLVIGVGALTAMALSGWLSERVGDVRIVAVTLLLIAAALPILGGASTVYVLMAGAFLLGLGSGGMDVAMNAEAVRVERGYGRSIMSSFHGIWSSGSMVGAAMGSLATARHVGPFVFLTAIAAVVVVVGLISTRFMSASTDHAVEPAPVFVIPPRALFGVAVVAGCAYLSEGSIGDWNALFLVREEHIRADIAAAAFASFSMAMAIGRLAGDWVIRKIGPEPTVRYGSVIAACALSAELIIGKPWIVFPALLIIGLSFAAIVPVAFSSAGNTPGMTPSRAIAAVATAGYGGFLCGPPAIGFLAEVIHLRGALGLVVLLCLTMTAASRSV